MTEVLRHWLAGDDFTMSGGGFMGKTWDSFVPGPTIWREALRVLKPGGHLLAFFGSRTYDMGTLAIRLAGFEIRDQIMWVYGSGFPKSLDVSKAIDRVRTEDVEPTRVICRAIRAAMDERKMKSRDLAPEFGNCHPRLIDHWAARDTDSQPSLPTWDQWQKLRTLLPLSADHDAEVWRLNGRKGQPGDAWDDRVVVDVQEMRDTSHVRIAVTADAAGYDAGARRAVDITAPATDAARQWEGWGTALKPAHEPICVARKPLSGTVAANVLAHGVGALNIDGCRVGDPFVSAGGNNFDSWRAGEGRDDRPDAHGESSAKMVPGRWPANIIHDGSDEVRAAFPDASGAVAPVRGDEPAPSTNATYGTYERRKASQPRREEDRNAARFFYCAKASTSDRGVGNTHPTVKPTDLMAYLCRLVTPPGGLVLDPFMGSGSTGKACMREGFRFIGCDMTPEYMMIAAERIGAAHRGE